MKVLVTGAAGFIGSATTLRLLARGDEVVGVDNLNDYYDVNLKKARLARQIDHSNYVQITADLEDRDAIAAAFAEHRPDRVINLAAQAGVRYAAINPYPYVSTNVQGFLHILEGCRHNGVEHLVYASTSSVYGANTTMPFSEHHGTQHPLTLYAATKKANEMMAHAYSHLYRTPTTGLRFFTVYGPWGRPDMALFMFTQKILAGEPIPVFNYGKHSRSFTYVDDIVEGVIRTLDNPPVVNPAWDAANPDPASSTAPYRLYNIGAEEKVDLLRYIEVLEECLGQKAQMQMLPLQDGDVPDTTADVTELMNNVGYKPRVTVEEGVRNFVDWYRSYYG